MNLRDKIIEKAESLDWTVRVDQYNSFGLIWGFWKMSPAGEDFGFEVVSEVEDVVREVSSYAHDFDPDDHAEMWIESRGKRGVPNSIRALLNDADAIDDMLEELADALRDVMRDYEEDQDEK